MNDWTDLDLSRPTERGKNLIEPLSFDRLLLEIGCNMPDITPENIEAHFEVALALAVEEARWVFRQNKDAIHRQAKRERDTP